MLVTIVLKVMVQIMVCLKSTSKLKQDCFHNKEVKAVDIYLHKSLAVNTVDKQL